MGRRSAVVTEYLHTDVPQETDQEHIRTGKAVGDTLVNFGDETKALNLARVIQTASSPLSSATESEEFQMIGRRSAKKEKANRLSCPISTSAF
jgi:hypothetical protein